MDIIKGLGNANKLMNRLLYQLDQNLNLGIHKINGGWFEKCNSKRVGSYYNHRP